MSNKNTVNWIFSTIIVFVLIVGISIWAKIGVDQNNYKNHQNTTRVQTCLDSDGTPIINGNNFQCIQR